MKTAGILFWTTASWTEQTKVQRKRIESFCSMFEPVRMVFGPPSTTRRTTGVESWNPKEKQKTRFCFWKFFSSDRSIRKLLKFLKLFEVDLNCFGWDCSLVKSSDSKWRLLNALETLFHRRTSSWFHRRRKWSECDSVQVTLLLCRSFEVFCIRILRCDLQAVRDRRYNPMLQFPFKQKSIFDHSKFSAFQENIEFEKLFLKRKN